MVIHSVKQKNVIKRKEDICYLQYAFLFGYVEIYSDTPQDIRKIK